MRELHKGTGDSLELPGTADDHPSATGIWTDCRNKIGIPIPFLPEHNGWKYFLSESGKQDGPVRVHSHLAQHRVADRIHRLRLKCKANDLVLFIANLGNQQQ